jgi:WD40 repeat protein
LAFSGDGRYLVTGGKDRIIRRWDTATGEEVGDPIPSACDVASLALFPDEPVVLVGGSGNAAYCYNLDTGKKYKEPLSSADEVRCVAITADGKRLIIAGRDRTIRLWDRNTWLPVQMADEQLMRHDDAVLALAVDPAGRFIVSGSRDNTARLWMLDRQNASKDMSMSGHSHHVSSVAVSKDGRLLLSVGESDHDTRLWDAATGKQVGEAVKHNENVGAVAFLPDGAHYFVAHDTGRVDMWAVPQPFPDQPDRIRDWVRFGSGWVRNPIGHRRLSVDEWKEALQNLLKEGGTFESKP